MYVIAREYNRGCLLIALLVSQVTAEVPPQLSDGQLPPEHLSRLK